MSDLTRDDIYDQDLGEGAIYQSIGPLEEVKLPLTKLGFEALIKRVTTEYQLPLDDSMRCVLSGYIHHLSNETNTVRLEQLGKVLHKSVTNATTWRIDQEIKLARKEKAIAEQKASSDGQPSLTVVEQDQGA